MFTKEQLCRDSFDIQTYPRLGPNISIRRSKSFCVVIDKVMGNYTPILPQQAVVLALCDGSLSMAEIAKVHSLAFECSISQSKDVVYHLFANATKIFLEFLDKPEPISLPFVPDDFIYEFEVQQNATRVPYDSPIEMILPLTHSCNMKCLYCFRASGDEMKQELTVEEHLDVVQQAIELGVVRCSITGGEPTLSKSFWPVIEMLTKNNVYPYIATNGSLLTSDDPRRLIDLGISVIQISFDAVTPSVFDKLVARKGLQPVVITTIRKLVDAGLTVRLKATLTKINTDELDAIIDFADNTGCSALSFEAFTQGYFGRGNKNLALNQEECIFIAERIEERQRSIFPLYIESFVRNGEWQSDKDIIACGGLVSGFVVQPNGDVGFCEMLYSPDYVVGNVRETRLETIWGNERYLNIIRPSESELDPICRTCEHLGKCGTGCFNLSLVDGRGMFGADPRCWQHSRISVC
ncbi:MAG: radical SAM protein [Chloroflexi bacterium]|nr:radical SAM protein [Chloroflexota bacterium]